MSKLEDKYPIHDYRFSADFPYNWMIPKVPRDRELGGEGKQPRDLWFDTYEEAVDFREKFLGEESDK